MEPTSNIQITQLEDEMKRSYLDYAMSVIVGRALPDVRDGLKPVHRRVLFAMHEMNNDWNKPYKKSARITGDVIGKYHPHGDTAVYDTIVRMAQDFSLRYPLVDGQGNFGSVDGDSAAAMRYTEIRLSRIAHELLADIEKDTVDHGPNYDESLEQPFVLPTRIPNLLVNGSAGIAVGMATNIPPHNMTEIVNGTLAVIENPDITLDELMEIIPGPDFPTHGIIHGARGIREAYETGRGRLHIRARTEFEQEGNAQRIIVNELPYQVNKARLIEKIAELVKNKKIEGISALRDESDKRGMRVVIELKRGENADVLLNQLFAQTQLEVSFGINMVALSKNIPRIFNLREMLDEFIAHRRDVVTRRSIFELRKARERAHILEGLAVALGNIDEIIDLIRASQTPPIAKESLMARPWNPATVLPMLEKSDPQRTRPDKLGLEFGLVDGNYHLSDVQAQAILDLRLNRLTGLEKEKIHQEYLDIMSQIDELLLILMSPARLMEVIGEELNEIIAKYGDERRTEIIAARFDIDDEDLIKPEEMVVTLSHLGYAKAQPLEEYRAQRRGGRGKMATTTREEDFVTKLFVANTHDHVLCFTSFGRVYWLKVYRFPTGGRSARGRPLVNLLQLDDGERVTSMMPIKTFDEGWYVFMATRQGVVKKTDLMDFSRPRANGVKAVELNEGDELVGTSLTNGECDVLLFSANGRAIRFSEQAVRAMGRTARGVRGMNLDDSDEIISLVIADEDAQEGAVLTASQQGIGKRTAIEVWPRKGRAGKGVIAMNLPDNENVKLVSALFVNDMDQMMLITDGGTLIRSNVSEVSQLGRITRGVKLINLGKKELLVSVERIEESQITSDDDEDDAIDVLEQDTNPEGATVEGDVPQNQDAGEASFDNDDSADDENEEGES